MDSSGRVLIPSLLRDYAELGKNTVLLGQGKKFELWDECGGNKRRDAYLHETGDAGQIPEALQTLSL